MIPGTILGTTTHGDGVDTIAGIRPGTTAYGAGTVTMDITGDGIPTATTEAPTVGTTTIGTIVGDGTLLATILAGTTLGRDAAMAV